MFHHRPDRHVASGEKDVKYAYFYSKFASKRVDERHDERWSWSPIDVWTPESFLCINRFEILALTTLVSY